MSLTAEAPSNELTNRLDRVDTSDPHAYDLADSTEQSGPYFDRFTEAEVLGSVTSNPIMAEITKLRREACQAALSHNQAVIDDKYDQISLIAMSQISED